MLFIVNMGIFTHALGLSVELGISIFYIMTIAFLLTPLAPGHENRSSFLRLLKIVFYPSVSITFPEILLADALTSMSKVFKVICTFIG